MSAKTISTKKVLSTSVPTSPVVTKMDFPDAIREIMNGNKVRRESWPVGEYGFMKEPYLMVMRDGEHKWTVTDGDFEGKDWVVV